MNLSVSNLAWDNHENEQILEIFSDIGINKIEGVPSKINSWDKLTNTEISQYKEYLDSKNLSMKSMQSIFFNTKIIDFKNQDEVITHFEQLIEISKILGVNVLVLGSPKLRKKYDGWSEDLIRIFNRLDFILDGTSIRVVIEPNTSMYGGEYFFTVFEIVDFIKKNGFKNIKTMIDTHNVILENENPIEILELYYDYIEHIHISEVNLSPFKNNEFHNNFSKKLQEMKYSKIITYEVLKHDSLRDSVKSFVDTYRIVNLNTIF
jgi:sugar phosphate isomerase/epimerase